MRPLAPRFAPAGRGSLRYLRRAASQSSVVNESRRDVLIVDGEELVGAKQNRIVNLTILVPAHTSLTIPVSCVEAGRWHSTSAEFAPADRAFHASGRRANVTQVSESLRTSSSRRSDQRAIWDEIDAKSARLGADSSTAAAAAMYEEKRDALDEFVKTLKPMDRQVGAVFAIRGHVVGLDAFDSPATWSELIPKLLRSYGLDALDSAVGAADSTVSDPSSFLEAVATATCKVYPAVGGGQDLRFEGAGVSGAALSMEKGILHAVAFPATDVTRPTARRSSGRV
jgi:hypothetical protein